MDEFEKAGADYAVDLLTENKRLKQIILSAPGADEPEFEIKYRKWWDTNFRPLLCEKDSATKADEDKEITIPTKRLYDLLEFETEAKKLKSLLVYAIDMLKAQTKIAEDIEQALKAKS